jgi:hypothetical protein
MPNYTLTYSPPAEGWPSFYSYDPEWIQGMNQFLYTFSGGNLFRHNTNEERNTFYDSYDPAEDSSTITSVFNDEPIVNKIFKTMAIEGNRPWSATLISDQQDGRFMDVGFFEKKEGDYFAFVRTVNNNPAEPDDYALRSLNGIALSQTVVGNVVNFPLTTDIGSILSAGDPLVVGSGDAFYFSPAPYTAVTFAGYVQSIEVDIPNGINRVTHDGSGTAPGINDPLWLGIKNQQAESSGLLGHYGVFKLTNEDTTAVEMFVAKSEVMKSYPG